MQGTERRRSLGRLGISVALLTAACMAALAGCAGKGLPHYPKAVRPAPSPAFVKAVKDSLKSGAWAGALREFFGDVYADELVDLVVYVPQDPGEPVRHALVWRGEERESLDGQKWVWVLVFTEVQYDLEAGVTSLDYQKDRFVVAVVKTFVGLLGKSVEPTPAVAVGRDTTYALPLIPLHGPQPGAERLFVASVRVPLSENTVNRVSVRRHSGQPLPQGQTFHYNFPNGTQSPFGLSIGAGLTVNSKSRRLRVDSTSVDVEARYPVKLYALVHAQLFKRSYPPWDPGFIGVALGTNLSDGDLFDDLVLGLSIGRLYHDLGLIVGVNYMEETRFVFPDGAPQADERRAFRLFLGGTFAL